jgi:hypothetical protein
MRRTLLTAVGVLTLALAVPGAALAHHGHGRHHRGHHGKAHHARFRFEHIGPAGVSAGPTAPTAPTGPSAPPATENAGTVVSYSTTTNILEVKLNDESLVKGKVTEDTRIECLKASTTPPTGTEPDQSPGDDSGEGDDQSSGDMSQSGEGWGDHKDGGDDDGGEVSTPAEPPCDTSALVPGAVVRAAELRIGPGGTEFESIVLVR